MVLFYLLFFVSEFVFFTCFRMVLFYLLVFVLELVILLANGWFCLICYFLFQNLFFYLLTDGFSFI